MKLIIQITCLTLLCCFMAPSKGTETPARELQEGSVDIYAHTRALPKAIAFSQNYRLPESYTYLDMWSNTQTKEIIILGECNAKRNETYLNQRSIVLYDPKNQMVLQRINLPQILKTSVHYIGGCFSEDGTYITIGAYEKLDLDRTFCVYKRVADNLASLIAYYSNTQDFHCTHPAINLIREYDTPVYEHYKTVTYIPAIKYRSPQGLAHDTSHSWTNFFYESTSDSIACMGWIDYLEKIPPIVKINGITGKCTIQQAAQEATSDTPNKLCKSYNQRWLVYLKDKQIYLLDRITNNIILSNIPYKISYLTDCCAGISFAKYHVDTNGLAMLHESSKPAYTMQIYNIKSGTLESTFSKPCKPVDKFSCIAFTVPFIIAKKSSSEILLLDISKKNKKTHKSFDRELPGTVDKRPYENFETSLQNAKTLTTPEAPKIASINTIPYKPALLGDGLCSQWIQRCSALPPQVWAYSCAAFIAPLIMAHIAHQPCLRALPVACIGATFTYLKFYTAYQAESTDIAKTIRSKECQPTRTEADYKKLIEQAYFFMHNTNKTYLEQNNKACAKQSERARQLYQALLSAKLLTQNPTIQTQAQQLLLALKEHVPATHMSGPLLQDPRY